MNKKLLVTLSLLTATVLATSAEACSIAGAQRFEPTLQYFEKNPGPRQKTGAKTGDYWEPIPAPLVKVASIKRGTSARSSTCEDAGILTLVVALPPTSTYKIDQFAVYFRVLEGQSPDEIFAEIPLKGSVGAEGMTLVLPWLDGAPARQRPLNLKVEAFLVTEGLNIGPSTAFEVRN